MRPRWSSASPRAAASERAWRRSSRKRITAERGQGGAGDGHGQDRREAVGDVREGGHHAVQAEHQGADERGRAEEHRPGDVQARVPARLARAEAAHRRMQGGQAEEHGLEDPPDVAP